MARRRLPAGAEQRGGQQCKHCRMIRGSSSGTDWTAFGSPTEPREWNYIRAGLTGAAGYPCAAQWQELHHEHRQASRHRPGPAALSTGAFHRRPGGGRAVRALGAASTTRRPGRYAGQVALRERRRDAGRPSRLPRRPLPAWAATPPLQRARVMFRFKTLIERETDDARAADHGRARQGAVGRARRSRRAAWRSSSSPAASRTCCGASTRENVGTGVDSWSHAPAGRRVRRHHAVQLPGDGARCGCSRSRSRAAIRSC